MPEASLRVLTGLAGLLVVASANQMLGDRGIATIGSAHARPLVQDEDAEAWDEEVADESGSGQAEDSADASGWTGEEPAPEEEGEEEEEEEEAGSVDEPPAADQPAADHIEPEPAAEAPASSEPANDPAPQASAPAASKQQRVREVLHQKIRDIVPGLEGHAFRDSDSLTDLGANSVDRAEIMMMTIETFGIEIPRTELVKATNIGELADLIAARMP